MWNKFWGPACALCICMALDAQSSRSTAKKTEHKSAVKAETKANPFDPRKPGLTEERVENEFNRLEKELLKRELPDSLDQIKKISDTLTNLSYRSIAESHHAISGHFEIAEVTKTDPVWYRNLDQRVDAFKNTVHSMNDAILMKDQVRYTKALETFRKQQADCLDFLRKPRPKLTKEKLTTLRNINIRRRRAAYHEQMKKKREINQQSK